MKRFVKYLGRQAAAVMKSQTARVVVAGGLAIGLGASQAFATNPIEWTAPTDLTPANIQSFTLGVASPFIGPVMGTGLLMAAGWALYRTVRGGVKRRG